MSSTNQKFSRATLKQQAAEILQIIEKKSYLDQEITPFKTTVYLDRTWTKFFNQKAENDLCSRLIKQNPISSKFETNIKVCQTTSLGMVDILRQEGSPNKICVLNFASALNPGGGFINGANAQEESLARSTNLYASLLEGKKYYELNNLVVKSGKVNKSKKQKSAEIGKTYSNNIIYSENVTNFRNSDGNLRDDPYILDIITCPAVNRTYTKNLSSEFIGNIMRERAYYLLWVAYNHKVTHLILGAWGCGVFKNDPWDVSKMFKSLLSNEFDGIFEEVVFPVPDEKTYKIFLMNL